jgi:hypothetical protein
MRISLALATAIVALAFAPSAAKAQVAATIRVGGHPIGGILRIGDRHGYYDRYHRAPRVIVIERYDHRKYKVKDHRQYGYRPIIIYHDRRGDRYYDAWRPGLSEVRVYERDGRYYRADDRARSRRYDDRYRYRDRDRDRDRDWDDDRDGARGRW